MLKEEMFGQDTKGGATFYRTVLLSQCTQPVTYAVAMYANDWKENIEFAYHKELETIECVVSQKDTEIVECDLTLTPEHPVTGF